MDFSPHPDMIPDSAREAVTDAALARGLELVGIGLAAAIEAIVAELRKEPEPLVKATRKRPARKTSAPG